MELVDKLPGALELDAVELTVLEPLDPEPVVEPPETPEAGAPADAVLPLEPVAIVLVELDTDAPLDVTPRSDALELQALATQGTVASTAIRKNSSVLRMLMQVREQWQHSRKSVTRDAPKGAKGTGWAVTGPEKSGSDRNLTASSAQFGDAFQTAQEPPSTKSGIFLDG